MDKTLKEAIIFISFSVGVAIILIVISKHYSEREKQIIVSNSKAQGFDSTKQKRALKISDSIQDAYARQDAETENDSLPDGEHADYFSMDTDQAIPGPWAPDNSFQIIKTKAYDFDDYVAPVDVWVKNVTNKMHSLMVTVRFYDGNNNLVGTTWDYGLNIAPGKIWMVSTSSGYASDKQHMSRATRFIAKVTRVH